MARIYVGGGSGDVEVPSGGGGAAAPQTVDVVSSITTGRARPETVIALSNPINVAAGQKVIVSATADLINSTGGPASVGFHVVVESGPDIPQGPGLVTPTIAGGDDFPLSAEATFLGLSPGTYTFALRLVIGRSLWTFGDFEITTQVIG